MYHMQLALTKIYFKHPLIGAVKLEHKAKDTYIKREKNIIRVESNRNHGKGLPKLFDQD